MITFNYSGRSRRLDQLIPIQPKFWHLFGGAPTFGARGRRVIGVMRLPDFFQFLFQAESQGTFVPKLFDQLIGSLQAFGSYVSFAKEPLPQQSYLAFV
jgi:hypothetical protein